MKRSISIAVLSGGLLPLAVFAGLMAPANAQSGAKPQLMPSGQLITPTEPAGSLFTNLNPELHDFPDYTVGQAIKTAISPDGGTLLAMTSGYNRLKGEGGKIIAADSNEYVFVIGISPGHMKVKQVIQVPNTFLGLAFSPDGHRFYASGGKDNEVHVFANSNGIWKEEQALQFGPEGKRSSKVRRGENIMISNVAVSANGNIVVAADISNDCIYIVELDKQGKSTGFSLRPNAEQDTELAEIRAAQSKMSSAELGAVTTGARESKGPHGGGSPYGVAIKGNTIAYISCESDREVDAVDIADPSSPKILSRIPVKGSPNNVLLNAAQSLLLVASDNSDIVSVIDTASNKVIEEIHTSVPSELVRGSQNLPGAAPNGLALSPDEKTLYVSNGGLNALAVISFAPGATHKVTGLIPTGWYPQSVSVSRDGRTIYDVNSKSDLGPNPLNTRGNRSASTIGKGTNQYILQLEKAGLQAIPTPGERELARLTQKVVENNYLNVAPNPQDELMMSELRKRIKHIVYIIKENRTYDQVLGDLDRGNGDPALAELGDVITPNEHSLARKFVDLDNTFCAGEVSADGWPWSTAARETDFRVKQTPLSYAKRGTPQGDIAPDGPAGELRAGNIWDQALRHGKTVRNYGFETRIARNATMALDPYAAKMPVANAVWPSLAKLTDVYFCPFGTQYPDFRRELEWEREFNEYAAKGNLPDLMLVRLLRDHQGSFDTAIDGMNTPETQTADNDYAVGKLIEKIAHSPYADSTLIFIIEDDAQAGPDHVNAHRTIAFVVGPYVKQGAVVSQRYSTVNMVRTIEDILGIGHMNINDAFQRPMTEVFDLNQSTWTYDVIVPKPIAKQLATALKQPQADLIPEFHNAKPAAYWARVTRGFDWSAEDRVPDVLFNRILWKGLTGENTYPTYRDQKDYRINREEVLKTRSIHLLYGEQAPEKQ